MPYIEVTDDVFQRPMSSLNLVVWNMLDILFDHAGDGARVRIAHVDACLVGQGPARCIAPGDKNQKLRPRQRHTASRSAVEEPSAICG
eukprot:3687562-Rhodomonas_salina.2